MYVKISEDLNFTPMRYQNYKTVLLRRRCKEYQTNETKHVSKTLKNKSNSKRKNSNNCSMPIFTNNYNVSQFSISQLSNIFLSRNFF